MADKDIKFADNVKGKWYVDEECILCSACITHAPDNFKESDDATHDLVFKQPEDESEEMQCVEAQEACPVDAIGNDGEDGSSD